MKNQLSRAIVAALALTFLVAPAAIAADLTDVGYLDQAAVGSLPQFVNVNRQLSAYQTQLGAQFNAALKSAKTDADRQNIRMRFSQEFSDKQHELIGPIYDRAQLAIAQVMSNKNLSIVLDKRIVVYGGQDITKDVIGLIQSSQAIAPPVASPPPAVIGYVDQSSLEGLPKIKQASDAMAAFAADQRKIFAGKMAQAKTDADKQQVASAFNKVISDKQDQELKPLADETRAATAAAARKKNLLLVVDRADVILGGTDITQDVQNALSK